MHRHFRGHHEIVDAGDAELGIDEQPFPIERDDLNLERLFLRFDRLEGIEIMRADPDHAAEKQDDQERDRPDDELDAAGIDKAGLVARPRVGGAKPPGKDEDADDRRHDDHQHDGEGIEQDLDVGGADRPLRLQYASRATCEQ